MNLQLFGGRGGSSGMGNQSGNTGFNNSPTVERAINRTGFTNEGGGNYSLDISGVGGGQILDETGGSRDPMMGRGGKVYSARAWDADYNMVGNTQYFGSLNAAKEFVKDSLRDVYGLRG